MSMNRDAASFDWRRDGAAVIFALLFPSLATWMYFVEFAGQGSSMRVTYVACKLLQFALPVCWVVLIQRESVGWQRLSWRGVGLGAVFGAIVVSAMMVAYYGMLQNEEFLAETPRMVWEKIAAMGVTSPGAFAGMALFYSGLHSLLEEYYWRWFVFRQLRRGLPFGWATTLSSLGFASHHVILLAVYFPPAYFWTATLFSSLCVAIGGAVWAWLYERSGSLLGPWVSHLLIDAGLMWLGFEMCRGFLHD